MAIRWFFFWFWLRAYVTHSPDFWTLPIECKCRTMVEWSQFITFASSRVHWRGSLCLNDLHQTFLNVECHYYQNDPPLQMRKPFSCRALSSGIVPIHGTNVSGCLCCFHPSIELKEKNILEMFQFLHLALQFSSVHDSTHYLQTTKLQYVNSNTTIELLIKNDNRKINP